MRTVKRVSMNIGGNNVNNSINNQNMLINPNQAQMVSTVSMVNGNEGNVNNVTSNTLNHEGNNITFQ